MPNIQLDYKPTERQLAYHASKSDYVLYGGAAGGGKSCATVVDAFLQCVMYPGFKAYLFRKTYRELEDTLIAEAQRWVPKEVATYNATAHEMRLTNGSLMRFRHCMNENDKFLYQGSEIYGLYIDELTHFTKSIYDFLVSRVRAPKDLNVRTFIKCTSNPGGVGHGWVKGTFIDPMPNGGIIEKQVFVESMNRTMRHKYEFIPAKLSDNPHLGIEYAANLESLPKAMRDAYLNGDWDTFTGQVFTEWRDNPDHYMDGLQTHVIDPFDIPYDWPRYCSYDHGYSKPFSVQWWAVGPDNRVYLYREWYGCADPGNAPNTGVTMDPKEIARGILDREEEERRAGINIFRLGDPAIWGTQGGESIGEMMQRMGVYFNAADNNRIHGKMQMHYRLKMREDGKPMLQVFKHCHQFIRTLPMLVYSLKKVEDVDTDCEDHCLTGDTLIRTESGYKPISDLVGTEGMVWGYDGDKAVLERYHDVRKTQENAEIYEVELEDGTIFRGTGNHPVLCSSGEWKPIQELTDADSIVRI